MIQPDVFALTYNFILTISVSLFVRDCLREIEISLALEVFNYIIHFAKGSSAGNHKVLTALVKIIETTQYSICLNQIEKTA